MLASTVEQLLEELAGLSLLTENLAAGISSKDDVLGRRLNILLDLGLAAGMLGLLWYTALELMRRVVRPIERATTVREHDAQVRLIADSMPALLVYIDRDRRHLFANKTAAAWYDLPIDQIVGRTIAEVLGQHADLRFSPYVAAALRGEEQRFSDAHRYPDGRFRTVDVLYTPDRGADGEVRGYYALVLDVGTEREADMRLRAIADNLPSLICNVDAEKRYRYVIRAAANWYAMPEAKLVGAHMADALLPEAYAALMPWIETTFRGEEQRFETIATYPDGQTRNVDIAYIPDFGADDTVRGIIALVTDTTALRQNDARLRLVADNLPAMIAYVDTSRTLRYVNRNFETWYQKTAFDVLGKHLDEAIPASIAAEVEPYIAQVLAGRPQRFSASGPYPDGKTRLVDVSYVPDIAPDGAVRGFVVLSIDVTATREADARLHAIADNLPIMIIYVDSDLRYRFINRTAEQWYGRPASQILGLRVDDFLGLRYEAIREHVEAAIAGEERRFQAQMRYPDGRMRVLELHHMPDRGADGAVRGYYGLVIDVTERNAAEEQLRQMQKMESIGQLTGGIAHDFNNMLAVVLGSLELLGDKGHVDAEDRELIESAREAARKGTAMTKRLLAFARKQQLRPQATDLSALVAGMKELLARYVGERVNLSVAIADDLWPATIDPVQLEVVILNLVLNARDAMPNRGTVVIRARNASLATDEAGADGALKAGDYVALSVIDDGAGMTPEVKAKAFDPFFTTKEQGKGTGLGLSMVYGFAQQSGGTAQIVSSPGAGTTVTLYLPRAETAAVAAKIAPSKAKAMADENALVPAARGAGVLVVDDDKGVLDFCLAAVRRLGHGAASATDASSALAAIKADPGIAILLTDVVLANGMNGLDLAHAAMRARPGLEVVFMSGYTDRTALPGGALPKNAALLGKPFEIGELAAALAEAAERSSSGNPRAKGEARLSAP